MNRATITLGAALAVGAAACGTPDGAPAMVPAAPALPAGPPAAPPGAGATAPCEAAPGDVEVVTGAPHATCLAADERDIFWSDGKAIHSTPLGGGPSRRHLDPQGAMWVVKLRVVGERLFVLQKEEGEEPCTSRIAVTARGGGAWSTVADGGCIHDFNVNGEWVVYTTEQSAVQGTLWKTRIEGGPPSALFSLFEGHSNVVSDGTSAYLALAIDQLHRVSLRSSAAVVLNEGDVAGVRGGAWNTHFAVDEDHVFFAFGNIRNTGVTLYRTGKEPGAEPTALGQLFGRVSRPDLDTRWPLGDLRQTTTHLVWASTMDGRVLRVTKDGHCPVEEIAANRKNPDFATPAGKYVVWLDRGGEAATIARRRVAP